MALSWDYIGSVSIGGHTESTTVTNGDGFGIDLISKDFYVDVSDVLLSDSSSGPSSPSSSADPSSDNNNSINTDGSACLCIPMSASVVYDQHGVVGGTTTTYLDNAEIDISYNGVYFDSVTISENNIIVSINNIYAENLYENDESYLYVNGVFVNTAYSRSVNIIDSRVYFTNPPELDLTSTSEFMDGDTTVEYGSDLTIRFLIKGISLSQLQNLCNVSVTSNNNYVTIVRQTSGTNSSNNSIVYIKITGNNSSPSSKTSRISLSITTKSEYISLNNGSDLTDSVIITSTNTIIYNTLIDVSQDSITLNKTPNINSRYALIELLGNTDDIIIYCYTGTSLSKPYKDNCDDYYSFGESFLNCTVTSNNTNIVAIESVEVITDFYEYYLIAKSAGTTTITLKTSNYTSNNVNLIYKATSKTITVTVTEQSLNPVSSGKIATINDINTKFNTTIPTDEQNLNLCVSYSMIKDIAVIAPLATNTQYSDNQLVILDAIVNITLISGGGIVEINIFNLKVNNEMSTMYRYQNGMTWEEFVNSDYNKSSFMIKGDLVVYIKDEIHSFVFRTTTNSQGIIINSTSINKSEKINNTYTYELTIIANA